VRALLAFYGPSPWRLLARPTPAGEAKGLVLSWVSTRAYRLARRTQSQHLGYGNGADLVAVAFVCSNESAIKKRGK
jgi:hypothetical protein